MSLQETSYSNVTSLRLAMEAPILQYSQARCTSEPFHCGEASVCHYGQPPFSKAVLRYSLLVLFVFCPGPARNPS